MDNTFIRRYVNQRIRENGETLTLKQQHENALKEIGFLKEKIRDIKPRFININLLIKSIMDSTNIDDDLKVVYSQIEHYASAAQNDAMDHPEYGKDETIDVVDTLKTFIESKDADNYKLSYEFPIECKSIYINVNANDLKKIALDPILNNAINHAFIEEKKDYFFQIKMSIIGIKQKWCAIDCKHNGVKSLYWENNSVKKFVRYCGGEWDESEKDGIFSKRMTFRINNILKDMNKDYFSVLWVNETRDKEPIQRYFESKGIKTIWAENMKEALAWLDEKKIDSIDYVIMHDHPFSPSDIQIEIKKTHRPVPVCVLYENDYPTPHDNEIKYHHANDIYSNAQKFVDEIKEGASRIEDNIIIDTFSEIFDILTFLECEDTYRSAVIAMLRKATSRKKKERTLEGTDIRRLIQFPLKKLSEYQLLPPNMPDKYNIDYICGDAVPYSLSQNNQKMIYDQQGPIIKEQYTRRFFLPLWYLTSEECHNVKSTIADNGYAFIWADLLYTIGSYIKDHQNKKENDKRKKIIDKEYYNELKKEYYRYKNDTVDKNNILTFTEWCNKNREN